MEFKEMNEEFRKELHEKLVTCFRDEETYSYMKENKSWNKLINDKTKNYKRQILVCFVHNMRVFYHLKNEVGGFDCSYRQSSLEKKKSY